VKNLARSFFVAGLTGAVLAIGSASPAPAQVQFVAGDLYLYGPGYSGGASGTGEIVRIDPSSGATNILLALATTNTRADQMAYDPWRDRLIFFGGLVPNHNEVYLVDVAGNLTSLGFPMVAGPSLGGFAPRGDGLIYFHGVNDPTRISYFDAANAVQTLMDASGTVPFTSTTYLANIRHMAYHEPTNSLVLASSSNVGNCAGGVTDAMNLRRLDLSPDGARVLAETCFQYDLKPGVFGEVPVGLGAGPDGDLLLTLDDNSNSTLSRMVRVAVAAASATPFAANGHPFAATIAAGCYSQDLARAVILDHGNGVLRAFWAGEVGAGTIIGLVGSTAQEATLIEIGLGAPHFGMTASPSQLSISTGGTQTWTMDFGVARAGLPYLVLGSVTGWIPGFLVNGVAIPLVPDPYLDFTLLYPNTPTLPGSFGLLDGLGRANATLVIPPLGPALLGLVAYHCTVAFTTTGVVQIASNPVPVTLVP